MLSGFIDVRNVVGTKKSVVTDNRRYRMTYKEEIRDLFSVPEDYYLAHCVSADYALGAGIAVEFNKRFDMRRRLKEEAPNYWQYLHCYGVLGGCILIDRVFNLVTKENYWHKPTYDSIRQALYRMRSICEANTIKKIAMPVIGCGLDRLRWDKVSAIIKEIFSETNIEILVCMR